MLFELTRLVDLVALGLALWMALYLFARGFASAITQRAVIVLLLVSIFYLGAYSSLYGVPWGSPAVRAVAIILALGTWFSLTYRLLPATARQPLIRLRVGIYILCALSALAAWRGAASMGEGPGGALFIARLGAGLITLVYPGTLLIVAAGIVHNMLVNKRISLAPEGAHFLAASVLIALGAAYGAVGLIGSRPMPRLILDVCVLVGILLLGLSVARYQSLLERRTTLEDFPVSVAAISAISIFYVALIARLGLFTGALAAALAIVILTHSIYDVIHETLAQLHIEREGAVRHGLRQLEDAAVGDRALQDRLRRALLLLCRAIRARGGFVALRNPGSESYLVVAQLHSLRIGSVLTSSLVDCEEMRPASEGLLNIAWLAPTFESDRQVGVIGIRGPAARLQYSAADLDLFVEVSDHVGTILALSRSPQTPVDAGLADQPAAPATPADLSAAERMLADAVTPLDPEFVRATEDALRHLTNLIELGDSSLAELLQVRGSTPAERGRNLNGLLRQAVESLRPSAERPLGTPSREWFPYLVLHEAYVVGTPNRAIMNRLYISEGTFNRTRRTALRGLARELLQTASRVFSSLGS